MATVERATSTYGKRYLTRKAVVYDSVQTKNLIVGGKDGESGLIQVVDANSSVIVNIDENGITLSNGAEIIGDNGVLTNLQYVSEGWGWLFANALDGGQSNWVGFNVDSTVTNTQKSFLNFPVTIPDNFTVTSAKIKLRHSPMNWDNGGGDSSTGYCRNIRAYVATNLGTTGYGAYASSYMIGGNTPTFTLISAVTAKTFTTSYGEHTTENFSSTFTTAGNYNISVMTSDSAPSWTAGTMNATLGAVTGILTGTLEIIGHLS